MTPKARMASKTFTSYALYACMLSMLVLVLPVACRHDQQPFPSEPPPSAPPVAIVRVEPSTGYAGTLLRITTHRQRNSISFDNTYAINDTGAWSIENIQDDTVYIRFPCVKLFKRLSINAIDAATHSNSSLTIGFTPYPEGCDQAVCVGYWNNSYSVDVGLSRRYHYGRDWTCYESGDSVVLQFGDTSDLGMHYERLRLLDQGINSLPKFVDFVAYGVADVYGPYNDTLTNGLIKIDQWNRHGVISGGVYFAGQPYRRISYMQTYFYAQRP